MDGLKSIIQYQTQEYGHIRVKLAEVLDSRSITRTSCVLLQGRNTRSLTDIIKESV